VNFETHKKIKNLLNIIQYYAKTILCVGNHLEFSIDKKKWKRQPNDYINVPFWTNVKKKYFPNGSKLKLCPIVVAILDFSLVKKKQKKTYTL